MFLHRIYFSNFVFSLSSELVFPLIRTCFPSHQNLFSPGTLDEAIIEPQVETLLMAADFYGISGLKKLAEKILVQQTKMENMLEKFVMADKYNAAELKHVARQLIVEHGYTVVKQKQWKRVFSKIQNPSLTIEILEAIAEEKKTEDEEVDWYGYGN